MDRDAYRKDPEVRDFLSWLGAMPEAVGEVPGSEPEAVQAASLGRVWSLQVRLDIPRSTPVPQPIMGVYPFAALPSMYRWRGRHMVTGDLFEAHGLLSGFRRNLRAAVRARNWVLAKSICEAIFDWAGERSKSARRAVNQLGAQLPAYLEECDQLMQLGTATLDSEGNLMLGQGGEAGGRPLPYFGSLWAKVYAVLTGVPIYDSRVAGAMACLVELWRVETGRTQRALPAQLRFPAVAVDAGRRTVHARFSNAVSPGTLWYTAASTPARWGGAIVRLGWLIDEIHGGHATAFQAHAFEAALFMAGYNCAGIAPAHRAARRPAAGQGLQGAQFA